MKLTPNQISKNVKITPIVLSETVSSEKFYKQFDHCPRCGKISDGPLTESCDDRDYNYNMIQHRRCHACLIRWEYTKYGNIQHDPAYQEFMHTRNNPSSRPDILVGLKNNYTNQGMLPPHPPSYLRSRQITESRCLFLIIGGIATILIGIGVLL